MKQKFVLPAAIVLCLHALLLLGFRKSAYLPPTKPSSPTIEVTPTVLPEPDLTVPQAGDESTASTKPADPVPVIRETPTPIDHPTITISSNPITTSVVSPDIKKLPEVFDPGSGIGGDRDGIISVASLENNPKAIRQITPLYPYDAKSRGQSGDVVVEFDVDTSGNVHNARVVSSNDPIFNEPTLRAIRMWKFEPGRKNGRLVPFRMDLPVKYNLNQ